MRYSRDGVMRGITAWPVFGLPVGAHHFEITSFDGRSAEVESSNGSTKLCLASSEDTLCTLSMPDVNLCIHQQPFELNVPSTFSAFLNTCHTLRLFFHGP